MLRRAALLLSVPVSLLDMHGKCLPVRDLPGSEDVYRGLRWLIFNVMESASAADSLIEQ
jgi:hypothetical protein